MNPQNPSNPSVPPGGTSYGGTSTQSSDTLTEAKNTVTQTAREAATKLKSTASTTVSRAKEEAERVAREKKEEAARRIGGYSSAIHDSARAFEEKDPNIAWFTHRAADRLQSVADYVRTRDFSGLREDSENMARRHPAAFFGGMFVAGLLVGNLIKASQRRAMEKSMQDDMAQDSEWMRRQQDDVSTPDLPMSSSPLPSTMGGI